MKLYSLLSSWNDTIILTTKHGKIFTKSDAEEYKKLKKPILVVFGSPKKGIHEILGDIKKNSKLCDDKLFSQSGNRDRKIR